MGGTSTQQNYFIRLCFTGKSGDPVSAACAKVVVDAVVPAKDMLMPQEVKNDVMASCKRFNDVWVSIDESENFDQKFVKDLAISDIIRPVVERQIEKEVDEKLLICLENLQNQVQTMLDAGKKKGKKGKGKKGKGKKGKGKGKKGKGKKGKKGKAGVKSEGEKRVKDMSDEDRMKELIGQCILQDIERADPVDLEDYVGDHNCTRSEAHEDAAENKNVLMQPPSYGQVRSFLMEFGCICLGSRYVREHCPLVTSLLLYGPTRSGKTMLARAIANSVGARWFDLSPKVLLENQLSIQQIAKAIFLTFDMAKKLEPSVIYIDEIEKIFVAGKKKKDAAAKLKVDASKMKKELLAMTSSIKKNTRVLVIGVTKDVFSEQVDVEALKSYFTDGTTGDELSLMCYCPFPDYATRSKLWKHFIEEKGVDLVQVIQDAGKSKPFDLSTLALVSEGYAPGSLAQAVHFCLTERRIQKYETFGKIFKTTEFLNNLARTRNYNFEDQIKKFASFSSEVSGRDAYMKALETAKKKELAEEDEPKKNR